MENNENTYSAGGSFETTIGKTKYEVVTNFKDEGMSMQEKALRVVKEGAEKSAEGGVILSEPYGVRGTRKGV
jgi:hypothetical protein